MDDSFFEEIFEFRFSISDGKVSEVDVHLWYFVDFACRLAAIMTDEHLQKGIIFPPVPRYAQLLLLNAIVVPPWDARKWGRRVLNGYFYLSLWMSTLIPKLQFWLIRECGWRSQVQPQKVLEPPLNAIEVPKCDGQGAMIRSHSPPTPIMLTIESKTVNNFWECSRISWKSKPFWCPILNKNLSTDHSNVAVRSDA